MSIFRFKGFEVRNEASAMKINTDSVLIGVLCTVSAMDSRVLDIGTGTGVVALIVAHRLEKARGAMSGSSVLGPADRIVGIDIDGNAANEAAYNFARSPWAENMFARHSALDCFDDGTYDLIVSNPPYYENSIQSPMERKRLARHTGGMSYRDVLDYAARNLSREGRTAMILPASEKMAVLGDASDKGLYLNRITMISTVSGKPASRIAVEFSRKRSPLVKEELSVYEGGSYSEAYIKKTSELLDCKF